MQKILQDMQTDPRAVQEWVPLPFAILEIKYLLTHATIL